MTVIVLQHKDCIWPNTLTQNTWKVIAVAHVVLTGLLYLNCDNQHLFHFLNCSEIEASHCFLAIKKMSQAVVQKSTSLFQTAFWWKGCCSILNFSENRALHNVKSVVAYLKVLRDEFKHLGHLFDRDICLCNDKPYRKRLLALRLIINKMSLYCQIQMATKH